MKEITYGEIIIPADIHIACGTECCLWWSSIAVYEEGDRSVYFEAASDIGKLTSRAFVINADENMLGDHKLTIRSKELRTREIIDTKTVTVHIVRPVSGNEKKNILMIGDSRSWHNNFGVQGVYREESGGKTSTAELMKLLKDSGADFNFLGTKISETDSTVRNFADNGRTFESANRELAEAGGLKNYIEVCCGAGEGAKLDCVTIMFGVNDLADWHTNNTLEQYDTFVKKIDGIIENAKTLVDTIHTLYPECEIILTPEPSYVATQDGFGYWGYSDRDCMQEWEYAGKALRKRLLETFDNRAYCDKVTMCSGGLWVDRIYGYPYTMEKAFARSEAAPVMRHYNNVHPHDSGYKVISDGYFGTISYLNL